VSSHPSDKSFLVIAAMVKPVLTAFTHREWTDEQNVPRSGGVIVAANHISPADGVVLGNALYDHGRLPRLLTKVEILRIPVLGPIMRATGQIAVYRDSDQAGNALRDATAALKAGDCVVIFPEGTNTKDPAYWPMRGHTGVARLALDSGAPVIPLAQWGAQEFFTPGKKPKFSRPVRKTVHFNAGRPVDLSAYAGREPTSEVLHGITDLIMARIREQLGVIRGETPPTEVLDRLHAV
jgi:1-acyl-sn-glycerol-3-phosphate acyltransferase